MNERKVIAIICVILAVIVIGIVALYGFSIKTVKPTLETFTVNKQQGFVATGKRLGRVEIWVVPTGTQVSEADFQMLSTMMLTTNNQDEQVWVSPIPQTPILSTEIFAKAFDQNNNEVGRISLPYTGATEIYNAVWGDGSATGTPIYSKQDVGEKG